MTEIKNTLGLEELQIFSDFEGYTMHTTGQDSTASLYLRASAITLLATGFQLIAYYGGWAQAVTLFGEAFHGGSDGITLFATWYFLFSTSTFLAGKAHAHRVFTYTNIALLVVGVVLIWKELAEHFGEQIIPTWNVLIVAAIGGIADWFVNYTLLQVNSEKIPKTLRVSHRANLLHIKQDIWLALMVIVSGIAIRFGIPYLDLVLGAIISCFILLEAVGLTYEEWSGRKFPYHVHPSDLFWSMCAFITGKKRKSHEHGDCHDNHHHH